MYKNANASVHKNTHASENNIQKCNKLGGTANMCMLEKITYRNVSFGEMLKIVTKMIKKNTCEDFKRN